jgi:ADP-heptose:LPS heptosyltransferase
MTVDLMRKIDFYLGIPLCFLLSVFVSPFLKKPRFGTVKNVLFIELSEMGSAILVDPAMRKIQKAVSANLFFVIFNKNAVSLKLLNTVPNENIFYYRENSGFLFVYDFFRFLIWTRTKQIDTVIDLELFSRFSALMTALSGARNRVGFHAFYNEGLYRGSFLTHKVAYNPSIHIAKNFVSLINAALSSTPQTPFSKTQISYDEVKLTKVEISHASKHLYLQQLGNALQLSDLESKSIILINANASDMLPLRRWMRPNYAKLIQLILNARPNSLVFLTGAESERSGLEELKNQVQDSRCVNVAGKIKFLELPHLYSVSKLMVTNDSGPAHFASVTHLPTFVLFGPETPDLYLALGNTKAIYAGLACSPCVSAANHRKSACNDNVCLKAITPDLVFETIREQLFL